MWILEDRQGHKHLHRTLDLQRTVKINPPNTLEGTTCYPHITNRNLGRQRKLAAPGPTAGERRSQDQNPGPTLGCLRSYNAFYTPTPGPSQLCHHCNIYTLHSYSTSLPAPLICFLSVTKFSPNVSKR